MKTARKPAYEVAKIGENVYHIDEFGADNIYLVIGSERALVIDTGTGFGDLRGEIRKYTALPLDVVVTHGHTDHAGGMGQFPEIYVHKDDCFWFMRASTKRFVRKVFFRVLKKDLAEGLTKKDVFKNEYKTKWIPIADGHVFDLGGKTVRVIHTPGHTPGSVVLHAEEDKLLFTGDDVCPALWMFLPYSTTIEAWLPGANRILELAKENTVYCGHRPSLQPYEQIEKTIEYAKIIMAAIKKNKVFSKYKVYPKFSKTEVCFIYRTGNVFRKNEK